MKKFIIILIILLSSFNVFAEEEFIKDSNCELKSLRLLVPKEDTNIDMIKFKKETKTYDVTINLNVFSIVGETESTKAMVDGLNTYSIALNETKVVDVTVTAEDGTTNTYTFKVKYVEPKSDNNNLSNLVLLVDDEPLDFQFDSKKVEFTYTVPANIDSVYIEGTVEDDRASLVKNFNSRFVDLKYGDNRKEIRVLSESGSTKSYFITITRLDDRNSNNFLSELIVNGKKVDLVTDVFEYIVEVRFNQDRSNIEAKSSNSKAVIEYQDINLIEGKNTPVIIKVTNEKKETQEYKIVINKLKESDSKVLLESISINDHPFEFNKNIYNYTIALNKGEDKLAFIVLPNTSDGMDVEFIGNNNLKDKSTVIVKVIDDDGEHRYTFNIIVENLFSLQNIICYSVAGIGICSFIYSVIKALKKQ